MKAVILNEITILIRLINIKFILIKMWSLFLIRFAELEKQ